MTLKAKLLGQAAAYADDAGWRVRSIRFFSENGQADEQADLVLRESYAPKTLATKIEMTVGQIAIGVVLVIAFFIGVNVLLALTFSFGG